MADFWGKHMIYDLALRRPLTFNIQSIAKHSCKSTHILSEYNKRWKRYK